MTVEIREEDRQLILLSLALCVRLRPGFDYACGEVAKKLSGEPMFTEFKLYNAHITHDLNAAESRHSREELVEQIRNREDSQQ